MQNGTTDIHIVNELNPRMNNEMTSWIKLGRVRHSEAKNFRSLKDLCVSNIIANLPMYTRKTFQPFKHLSVEVMSVLLDGLYALNQTSLKYAPAVLQKNFFTENCYKLELQLECWYNDEIGEILKHLISVGRSSLARLYLNMIPASCVTSLNEVFRNMTKLEVLHVTCRPVSAINNRSLRIIGASLGELRELVLDGFGVTDKGVKYLCVDDGVHGQCKKLEVLRFDVRQKGITFRGILAALENLPSLREFPHKNFFKAVLEYHKKHGAPLLNMRAVLKVPHFTKPEDYEDDSELDEEYQVETDLNDETLGIFVETIPQISLLSLEGDIQIKPSTLCKAISIEQLTLKGDFLTEMFLIPIIKKFTSNIKSLELETSSEIDISLIAKYCPELTSLYWKCKPSLYLKHRMNKFGANLRVLKFGSVHVAEAALVSALTESGRNLEVLCLHHVENLTEKLMDEILLTAARNREIFSKLKHMEIYSQQLTFKHIALLYCVTPKVETRNVGSSNVSGQESNLLQNFLLSFDAE